MYVIVDLETTGLDPERCQILEFGMIIYDDDLTEIDPFQALINPTMSQEDLERRLPDVVLGMHTDNGLIKDLYTKDVQSLRNVEATAVAILNYNNAAGLPLTGSTISFDRAFLKKYMPKLESTFHYRNIDVSSFKILAEMKGLGTPPPGNKSHRVLSDVNDTKDDLKWFIDNCLIKPEVAPNVQPQV